MQPHIYIPVTAIITITVSLISNYIITIKKQEKLQERIRNMEATLHELKEHDKELSNTSADVKVQQSKLESIESDVNSLKQLPVQFARLESKVDTSFKSIESILAEIKRKI